MKICTNFSNAQWKSWLRLITVLVLRWYLFFFSSFSAITVWFLCHFHFFIIVVNFQVSQSPCYRSVRLPHQLRGSLLHEMETYVLEALVDKELEKMVLSDVFYMCALLSNFMFGSYITRLVIYLHLFSITLGA